MIHDAVRSRARSALGHISSQTLSRLTNVVVSVGLARELPPTQFGAVALVLVLYGAVISINGMMLGPLASLHAERREGKAPQADLLGASLILWLPVSVVGALVSMMWWGVGSSALLTVSLALPFLVLHDMLRFSAFAQGRPWTAAGLDGAWLAGLVLLWMVDGASHRYLLEAWCLVAALVVMGSLSMAKLLPDLVAGFSLLRGERTRVAHFGADGLLVALSSHLLVAVSAPLVGLADFAAIRGAQVVAGPLGVLHTALGVALMPRVAAMLDRGENARHVSARWVSLGTLLVLLFAVSSAAIPDSLGHALLGETWPGARDFLPLILFGMAAQLAALHYQTLLRCMAGAGRALVRARALSTVVVLASGSLGLVVSDAWGFLIGLAAGRVLSFFVWRVTEGQLSRDAAD